MIFLLDNIGQPLYHLFFQYHYLAHKNQVPTLLNEIDDISEIAQYLNGLALDQWEYTDDAPNPEEVECQSLLLSRHALIAAKRMTVLQKPLNVYMMCS